MRALHAYAKSDPSQLVYEEASVPSLAPDDVLLRNSSGSTSCSGASSAHVAIRAR